MPRLKTLLSRCLAALLATVTGLAPALACQEEAMLVFDASGSMSIARDGLPKIDIAREAAADVLPELTRNRATGLVTYGGEHGEGCSGVSLRLAPMTNSAIPEKPKSREIFSLSISSSSSGLTPVLSKTKTKRTR